MYTEPYEPSNRILWVETVSGQILCKFVQTLFLPPGSYLRVLVAQFTLDFTPEHKSDNKKSVQKMLKILAACPLMNPLDTQ